jgi:dipeptidase
VPRAHVAAVGNSCTIRKMNRSDSENFLYSSGVTKLAEEMGWWSPKDDLPGFFDFFGAYGYTPDTAGASDPAAAQMMKDTLSFYSGRRMWRIFSLLSPAEGAKLDPNKGNLPETKDPYPGSVPAPKGSVSAQMVMDVLRDHYEGTAYDLTAGMAAGPFGSPNRGPVSPRGTRGLWERAISMHRGSWSYVLEAKPEGRSVSWLGYDSPHGAAYLPFFGSAAEGAPESFHSHEGYMSKFSTKVAWWAFNMVNQYSDLNFKLINKDVRAKAKQIEDEGQELVA